MSLPVPITDHGCVEHGDATVRAHTVPLTVAMMAKPVEHAPLHAKPNAAALLPRLATPPHGGRGGSRPLAPRPGERQMRAAEGAGLGAQRRRRGEARGSLGRGCGAIGSGTTCGEAGTGGPSRDWPTPQGGRPRLARLAARRPRPRTLPRRRRCGRGRDWAGPRLLRPDWLGRSGGTCSPAPASPGAAVRMRGR